MITLKHLIAGRIPTHLGPSAEGWTRTVMIFLVIVVVAGVVAMWNRSRYHPQQAPPQSSCVARRDIAAALVLTLGTVEKHVAGIFAKLGLPACQTDNRRVLAVLLYPGS